MMIGSRKITPPRMLRIVPLGDFHIFLRPNSSTRASSGVIVAHLTPTPCRLIALAAVDRHLVVGGVAVLDAEVVVLEVHVEVRQDQLVLDELPDDARHLVAVEFDDRPLDLDLRHGDLPARRFLLASRYLARFDRLQPGPSLLNMADLRTPSAVDRARRRLPGRPRRTRPDLGHHPGHRRARRRAAGPVARLAGVDVAAAAAHPDRPCDGRDPVDSTDRVTVAALRDELELAEEIRRGRRSAVPPEQHRLTGAVGARRRST